MLLAGRPEFDSRQRQWWYFLFFTASRPSPGPTQSPIQRVSGVKRPRR